MISSEFHHESPFYVSFWLILLEIFEVLFSILYFSIFARDRNFFKPLQRRGAAGRFFHGGVAALLEL